VRASWVSGWSWFLSIGVPVFQDLYGTQASTEFRMMTGVGITF